MAKPDDVDRMLDELLKGKKPEEILGQEGLLKELTKRLVERALQAEMTAHLGYEKHAAEGRNSGNSRNGTTPKQVLAESGELSIQVPRDRKGDFEPQLVPNDQHRAGVGTPIRIKPPYAAILIRQCAPVLVLELCLW